MKHILFFIVLVFGFIGTVNAKPPIFVDNYTDAQQISQDLNVDILLIFSADWCKYCDVLKQDLTNNLELLENQIILIVNYEDNAKLVKEYRVKKLPQSFKLHKGHIVKKITGYQGIQKYLEWYNGR